MRRQPVLLGHVRPGAQVPGVHRGGGGCNRGGGWRPDLPQRRPTGERAASRPAWHPHREPAERQQVDGHRDARQVEGQQRPSHADDHRTDPVPDQKARQRVAELVDRNDDQEDDQEPEDLLARPPERHLPVRQRPGDEHQPRQDPHPGCNRPLPALHKDLNVLAHRTNVGRLRVSISGPPCQRAASRRPRTRTKNTSAARVDPEAPRSSWR